ncbi:hypothetical protein AKJ09_10591 [Labilithrix luteola]|uniref:Uncharacterized protein n=1 Tax=Labilithrix luteola TaxID=1391654 RepID=A0A0K1QDY0_9BACT|nr:hypothetical protein AKJ09_10591 [Labilithrix luteola]
MTEATDAKPLIPENIGKARSVSIPQDFSRIRDSCIRKNGSDTKLT